LCLGPARHDYRAVPGPPSRHGGPTRAQHEIGPTRCQPVNFSLLRAHPTISYKNQNSSNPNPNSIPTSSLSWGWLAGCVPLRPPAPPPRLGAEPASSSSAMARPPVRLFVRHCQEPSRPPPLLLQVQGQATPTAASSAAPPRPGRAPAVSSSTAAAAGRREPHRRRKRVGAAGRCSTVGPDGLDGPLGLTVPQAGPARHEGH
jgi:hypothetical protein